MENNNTTRRIHPLVGGAAISVILVSLTGVAAITGLLPNSHSTNSPESATATTAPAAGANTLAAAIPGSTAPAAPLARSDADDMKSAPAQQHSPTQRTARATHAQPRHAYASEQVAQAPAICTSCGRVESVQALHQQAKPSGVGVVAGAVLGGVLGNQVGGGNGRALATVAGAVGGGYAGNEIEKRGRATTSYEVRVRMEDGSVRSFPYAQQPGWSVGDRVRVVNGHLAERA